MISLSQQIGAVDINETFRRRLINNLVQRNDSDGFKDYIEKLNLTSLSSYYDRGKIPDFFSYCKERVLQELKNTYDITLDLNDKPFIYQLNFDLDQQSYIKFAYKLHGYLKTQILKSQKENIDMISASLDYVSIPQMYDLYQENQEKKVTFNFQGNAS